MNSFIYKEACPDYYPKQPPQRDFSFQINDLEAARHSFLYFLYVDENDGIKLVNLFGKIWETIKGGLGFENRTSAVRVKSEVLKLLHYGSAHGYLDDTFIRTHQSIIQIYLGINGKSKQGISGVIKEKLINFCIRHKKDLAPCFWDQFFIAPQIKQPLTGNREFGVSHLILAQQAQNNSTPLTVLQKTIKIAGGFFNSKNERIQNARQEAIRQYEFAFNSGNTSEVFQASLRSQFQSFVETNWNDGLNGNNWEELDQKQRILGLIRALSSTAHQQGYHSEAEKYAEFGLKYFPRNLDLSIVHCQAKSAQNQDLEAIDQLEQLLKESYRGSAAPDQKHKILTTIQSFISKARENKDNNYLNRCCQLGLKYFPNDIEFGLTRCEWLVQENKSQESYNQLENTLTAGRTQRAHVIFSKFTSSQNMRLLSLIKSLCSIAHQASNPRDVEKYAEFGLQFFSSDFGLYLLQAEARVKQNKFQEAQGSYVLLEQRAHVLEKRLTRLTENERVELVKIYSILGEIDCHVASSPSVVPNYEQAGIFFKKAWELDKTNSELEPKIFYCLMQTYRALTQKNQSYLGQASSLMGWTDHQANELRLLQEAGNFIGQITFQDLQELIAQSELQKKYDQAAQLYEQGIKKWPNEVWKISNQTDYEYALRLSSRGELKEAYDRMELLLTKNPKNKTYQQKLLLLAKQLGETHSTQRKFELAIDYFGRALKLNPSELDEKEIKKELCSLYYTLAWEYVEKCLVDFAVYSAQYDAFIQKEPNKWEPHKKAHAEDLQQALRYYNQAIFYEPDNSALYFEKAELLNFFEMREESDLKAYELAVYYNPDRPFYLLRLSEIYKNNKNIKEAEKYEKKAGAGREGIVTTYRHWYDNRFQQGKHWEIDPHKYD